MLLQVGDRCGECEDEHIDVLLDRPLAYAPYNPDNAAENTNAKYANSLPGPRGFANPWSMRGGSTFSPEAVGTWVSDWQWVPCESFSHDTCAQLMTRVGYTNVWTPMSTPGKLKCGTTYSDESLLDVPKQELGSHIRAKCLDKYPTSRVGAFSFFWPGLAVLHAL